MKQNETYKRALFEQFSIRWTDDNLVRFRGLRFSVIDCLSELAVGESIDINSTLTTSSNLQSAVRKLRLCEDMAFSISDKVGESRFTVTRLC